MAEEKASLNFSTHKRSYGTAGTRAMRPKPAETVRHEICEGDTLQGIALRYGVSVEDIRLENHLWASDSLFLRPHLMIPLSHRSQPQASGPSSCGLSPAIPDGKVKKKSRSAGATPNTSASPSPVNASNSVSSSPSPRDPVSTAGSLDKSSAANFLASFDTQLTVTKTAVRQFESTVEQRIDELGASANAEAQAAAEAHAERSKWETKKSGKAFGPPQPQQQRSGLRRFLPSGRGGSSSSSRNVSRMDSKQQAALDAQDEDMFDL